MHQVKTHAPSAAISICHVAVADLWAGAEVQLKVLLSKLLQMPGLKLSVILFNGGRLEKEIEKLGIPIVVFSEKQWGNSKLFFQLVHHLKEANVQIVHTHKYKDTILAAPAAKLCGIPHVVRTVHGLPEPFQGIQAVKMKLYESIERAVHRCCVDAIIGVSTQIEAKCKARGDVHRVTCIQNGIDLHERSSQTDRWHTRKELGIDPGTHLIGTVGRLTSVKGLPYLLMATQHLLRQGIKVKVLIVGDGAIRSDLEAQAGDLGIFEDVVFSGHRDDMDDLLWAMDIFVLPSLSEGIPMALLEAMAASRAVVASRVGGIPEVIHEGVEGFLVEPRDVKSLTERCQQLIQFPDLARRMGEKARMRVEQDFSASSMARKVALLYRDLLAAV